MRDVACQKLSGKVVVITGAAQGLGEALAHRLADEGARVVVADLNAEAAKKVASELPDAIAFGVDVCDENQCIAMAQAAVDRYGRLDALVSNAAILLSGPIESLTARQFAKVVDVNLNGYYNCCRAVVPHLRAAGKGAIVQINSKSGKKGSAKNSAYAASKFGGIGLTQSLALELATENIRVNALCPGNLLDSPLWVNSLYEQYARNQGITKEEVRQKYIDQVPMKRGCQYDDVANAMVFLLSDDASYMTGQAINVTGGQQMN
ncbi:MAG: sorbitol-6-phosphate dehydrogenase [Clostridiales bacterium]|nr:sorbitol-6-phosphate dehydrogenase [Clostridiales bacterium]